MKKTLIAYKLEKPSNMTNSRDYSKKLMDAINTIKTLSIALGSKMVPTSIIVIVSKEEIPDLTPYMTVLERPLTEREQDWLKAIDTNIFVREVITA